MQPLHGLYSVFGAIKMFGIDLIMVNFG